jgi:hypothetical protein
MLHMNSWNNCVWYKKIRNLVKLRIAAFMPQHGAPTHMMASFQQVAFAVNAGGLFLE